MGDVVIYIGIIIAGFTIRGGLREIAKAISRATGEDSPENGDPDAQ